MVSLATGHFVYESECVVSQLNRKSGIFVNCTLGSSYDENVPEDMRSQANF